MRNPQGGGGGAVGACPSTVGQNIGISVIIIIQDRSMPEKLGGGGGGTK